MRNHILITITGFLLLGAVWGVCGLTEIAGDDTVRIDISVFDNPQRPAALFDHDDHNEKALLDEECALCHHVYEDGQLVPDESSEDSMCSDCHGLNPDKENSIPLRAAFHDRCKTCHFSTGKGPVLCGECHTK